MLLGGTTIRGSVFSVTVVALIIDVGFFGNVLPFFSLPGTNSATSAESFHFESLKAFVC